MLPMTGCLYGMHVEGVERDQLVEQPERRVLDAHPALFLHDFALGDERLLVDPQRRHAIGFHPHHQRQVLRGNRLPEHRRVLVGVGVGLAADRRDDRGVLLGLDVARALEHQVLEEVREAGAARFLVLRADVIPELDVDDRRRLVLVQDDDHAVRQHEPLVFELRRPHRRLQRHIPDRRPPRRQHEQRAARLSSSVLLIRYSLFVISLRASSAVLRARSSCLRISGSLRNTADARRHSLLSIAG